MKISNQTLVYLLFSLIFTCGIAVTAHADIHPTTHTTQEVQDKHNKIASQRMEFIRKNVQISDEQEKALNNALVSFDKKRFTIWKQSLDLRKSLEKEENMSEDEANKNLQRLLDLDKELDKAHQVFYSDLESIGFSALQRLKIYICLKNFHSRMGRSLRD